MGLERRWGEREATAQIMRNLEYYAKEHASLRKVI